nr:hypothetical protein [Tanacetum cinerariifolium]
MVDITVVTVSRIFDRFRNLGSNTLRSDSMSQAAADNLFNDCSIEENIHILEENVRKCKTPSVDVQMIRNGGDVSTRLSTGGPDVSSSVDVQIHGINLGSNTLRSDSMSQAAADNLSNDGSIEENNPIS